MRWVLWLEKPITFKRKKDLLKYCEDKNISIFMFGKIK